MSVSESAKYLGISEDRVKKLVEAGELPEDLNSLAVVMWKWEQSRKAEEAKR